MPAQWLKATSGHATAWLDRPGGLSLPNGVAELSPPKAEPFTVAAVYDRRLFPLTPVPSPAPRRGEPLILLFYLWCKGTRI